MGSVSADTLTRVAPLNESTTLPGAERQPMTEGDKCECGAELPWHLFEVGLTAHVCSCERRYVVKDGTVEQSGMARNPFVPEVN